MSSDWNLILEKCKCPSHPAGNCGPSGDFPPREGWAREPAPRGPGPDPSARLPSVSQKPSALLLQLLGAGLPAIVLGSLSVILGPLRKEQTARKTQGSLKMLVIFLCVVWNKRGIQETQHCSGQQ